AGEVWTACDATGERLVRLLPGPCPEATLTRLRGLRHPALAADELLLAPGGRLAVVAEAGGGAPAGRPAEVPRGAGAAPRRGRPRRGPSCSPTWPTSPAASTTWRPPRACVT